MMIIILCTRYYHANIDITRKKIKQLIEAGDWITDSEMKKKLLETLDIPNPGQDLENLTKRLDNLENLKKLDDLEHLKEKLYMIHEEIEKKQFVIMVDDNMDKVKKP